VGEGSSISTMDSSEAKDEANRAKRLKARKASPVRQFFSSIRVIVFLVLLGFVIIFCTVVGVTTVVEIRGVYEKMDTLDLKERVQNAVTGLLQAVISLLYRITMMYSEAAYYPLLNNPYVLANFTLTEQILATAIYQGEEIISAYAGLTQYYFLPFQLAMGWDQNWNLRLAYYRPCRNPGDRVKCEMVPPKEVFLPTSRAKIPKAFLKLNETRPNCSNNGNCTGIMNIPWDEGGPMIFSLYNVGQYSSVMSTYNMTFPFDNWYFLVAANALLFNQITAHRTGMCMSFYTSNEDLPPYMEDEFKDKKKKNQILSPADIKWENVSYSHYTELDTGAVTLDQEYYAAKKSEYSEKKSDRAYCDDSYDHGDDDYTSMSSACLAYKTFDFEKGETDNVSVAFRFEYHDPLTKSYVASVVNMLFVLFAMFFVANALVFVYFNFAFLVPLDRVRKMRADLIKNTVSGLQDDGLIAKDLFGDMVDDTALIEANGDEITVMLTLQDRLDALYSTIIKSRVDEVKSARSVTRKELCAMRVMNHFMHRDDKSLRSILPGLMDPDEVSGRSRRNKGEGNAINDLTSAKRAFRSLKAVLSNNIATQFFKAFCIQRGRSSVNSFFFLMDVSWLHQVEAGGRDEQEDFLSAMFTDTVGAASPPMSPRSPPMSPRSLMSPRSPVSPFNDEPGTPMAPLPEGDRPHHSHFVKANESGVSPAVDSSVSSGSTIPPTSTVPDQKTDGEREKKKPKNLKVSVAKPSGLGPLSPKASNVEQFSSKISDAIAHFIHESYFGKRSLSHRDMRHAALLGCSQIPDYVALRDHENITFSPVMFDNLVAAVTKKINAEVLPQFLNSVSFQVMVYALKITGFFENQQTNDSKDSERMPLLDGDELLKGMWAACVDPSSNEGKETGDEDDSDSDSADEDDNHKDVKDGKNDHAEADKKPSSSSAGKKSVTAESNDKDEDSSSSDDKSSDSDKE